MTLWGMTVSRYSHLAARALVKRHEEAAPVSRDGEKSPPETLQSDFQRRYYWV